VNFEDGDTAEVELPSDDAKILLSPNVLQEAVKSAGQGRIVSSLAAVLKKKALSRDIFNAISGACFPLADLIREGKATFKSEQKVMREILKVLRNALLASGKELIKESHWDALLDALCEPGQEGFRFGLLDIEQFKCVGTDGGGGGGEKQKAGVKEGKKGIDGKEGVKQEKNKEEERDKEREKATRKEKEDGNGVGLKKEESKKEKKKDKGKDKGKQGKEKKGTEEGAKEAGKSGGGDGDGGLGQLKNKGARCEVFSAGEWWEAKVRKVRVLEGVEQVYSSFFFFLLKKKCLYSVFYVACLCVFFFVLKVRVLEGVEQVYVHYKGGNKEDDEWVELTPERVRPPQDGTHVSHHAAAQGTQLAFLFVLVLVQMLMQTTAR